MAADAILIFFFFLLSLFSRDNNARHFIWIGKQFSWNAKPYFVRKKKWEKLRLSSSRFSLALQECNSGNKHTNPDEPTGAKIDLSAPFAFALSHIFTSHNPDTKFHFHFNNKILALKPKSKLTNRLIQVPAGTWRLYNVGSTSWRCIDIILTTCACWVDCSVLF